MSQRGGEIDDRGGEHLLLRRPGMYARDLRLRLLTSECSSRAAQAHSARALTPVPDEDQTLRDAQRTDDVTARTSIAAKASGTDQ